MRIGYLVDLHGGPYDQPMPDRQNVVETMEAMIEECIVAERSGFHSIQVPDRHGRTETYFPGPLQILTEKAKECIQRFGEEVCSHFHRKDPPIEHSAIPESCRW